MSSYFIQVMEPSTSRTARATSWQEATPCCRRACCNAFVVTCSRATWGGHDLALVYQLGWPRTNLRKRRFSRATSATRIQEKNRSSSHNTTEQGCVRAAPCVLCCAAEEKQEGKNEGHHQPDLACRSAACRRRTIAVAMRPEHVRTGIDAIY
jgi:hypothetical protein